jgi:anthranilate phosphoribosyltransferase
MAQVIEYLEKLLDGEDLTFQEAGGLLDAVLDGSAAPAQVAAFLTAMRVKGETVEEIAGLAGSLRGHAVRVETGIDNLVDTCGTGGAAVKTFNISTASAFVVAGAGGHVAKHGNRAITSNCGSADVLAALGVELSPGAETVAECIKTAGVGFMFAPSFHPAMKYVQPVRKELGFRTVFNILGPLANPAFAQNQVMGVADIQMMPTIVEVLKRLGVKRAMVVHSVGLDEISTMSPTKMLFLSADGSIKEETINCEDFGIAKASIDDLKSGDAVENAATIKAILNGTETGPKKDIVVLNAAAAIIVASLADGFGDAIAMANESIESGKAKAALDKMIEISNR